MKVFYWQLKREFWEYRGGLLWTPLIVAAVFLVLNLLGIISAEWLHHGNFSFNGVDFNHLDDVGNTHGYRIDLNQLPDSVSAHEFRHAVGLTLDVVLVAPAILLAMVMGFVIFGYSLGALYNDRRDRSILFWKSLPLSDTSTVLAKLVTALLVAPIISTVIGLAAGLLMILMFCITLSFHGLMPWNLLSYGHPLQVSGDLLALIPLYAAWAIPTVGWLLMCSAWSRSKPFLLAVVVPIGIALMLGWFRLIHVIALPFGSVFKMVVARLLTGVFPGTWLDQNQLQALARIRADLNAPEIFDLGVSYTTFGRLDLWLGVLAGAIFIAVAIWCRRWREDA